MKTYIMFFLFALTTVVHPVYCQDRHVVDSLSELIEVKSGEEKYFAAHSLAGLYIDVDNEKALSLSQEAEKIAVETGDSLLIIKSKRLQGQILIRLGKPLVVISLLEPIVAHGSSRLLGEEYLIAANVLSLGHLFIGEFDKALEYLFRTNEIARSLDNDYYEVVSTNNIGIVYYKLKDYRKALPFMIRGYLKGDSLGILGFQSPLNISLCYSQLADYATARIYLSKSIAVCGEDCSLQALVHQKYASGSIYYGLKQYEKAENEFLSSLNFSRKVNDYRMQLDNIYLLAKMSLERENFGKAEEYLKAGEKLIARKLPFNIETIKVYRELSELYLRVGDFKKASSCQSLYISLKDSVYNEALMNNLMKIESGHIQRQKEATIAAQQEVILLREQMLHRQLIVSILVTILAATAIALLFFVYRSYRIKKGYNLLLQKKIRERTDELEVMVGLLSNAINERELELGRLGSVISESAKSLKGLTVAVQLDNSHEHLPTYVATLHGVIARLSDSNRKVQHAKTA